MKVKSTLAEFITIYYEDGNKIVEFQSDDIDKSENSICRLLDYFIVGICLM